MRCFAATVLVAPLLLACAARGADADSDRKEFIRQCEEFCDHVFVCGTNDEIENNDCRLACPPFYDTVSEDCLDAFDAFGYCRVDTGCEVYSDPELCDLERSELRAICYGE